MSNCNVKMAEAEYDDMGMVPGDVYGDQLHYAENDMYAEDAVSERCMIKRLKTAILIVNTGMPDLLCRAFQQPT